MIVFFASFLIYLFTLFPGAAPYRDTGEMVSAAHTLGIAHPPGYPFYVLLSKAFLVITHLGNAGYRMNVLSALAGAGAAWVLYRLLLRLRTGKTVAALAALVFSTSYLQWYLSLVSEMYTLNTFFAAVLVLLLYRLSLPGGKKENLPLWYFAALIFGAALGNRMDLLLILPAFLWAGFKDRRHLSFADVAAVLACFAAGLSVFLYLPLRSSQGPLLDWNHPATLERLWDTIRRKTHGGTLDLISESYRSGENFSATFRFYLSHLFEGFAYLGLPSALYGLGVLWKRERTFAAATLLAWIFTCLVFIFMGNMPPNPHALAILEAHFLLPNVIVAVWMGAGCAAIIRALPAPLGPRVVTILLTAMIVANLSNNRPALNKREQFVAYDYAKNVLRSLPPDSLLVMKKDVQLFALWNQQFVENRRADAAIVSQGLAASPWYVAAFSRRFPEVRLAPLRSGEEWLRFSRLNAGREILFSQDAEYSPPPGYREGPDGLVGRLVTGLPSGVRGETLLDHIYAYRGKYDYDGYREFFTPDIVEDYAKAELQLGEYLLGAGQYERAQGRFLKVLRLHSLFPLAQVSIAYGLYQEGKYDAAAEAYRRAVAQYRAMSALSEKYNAVDEVKSALRKDLSDVYISLGACCQKLRKPDESLAAYQDAVEAFPRQPKAYFNRAVIFWERGDGDGVIRELENALRIDPGYREADFYLAQARRKWGK